MESGKSTSSHCRCWGLTNSQVAFLSLLGYYLYESARRSIDLIQKYSPASSVYLLNQPQRHPCTLAVRVPTRLEKLDFIHFACTIPVPIVNLVQTSSFSSTFSIPAVSKYRYRHIMCNWGTLYSSWGHTTHSPCLSSKSQFALSSFLLLCKADRFWELPKYP